MRFTKSFKLAVVAMVAANVVTVPSSFAATATGNLGVTATVLSTCSVSSTPVAFGAYTFSAVDSTGSITVTCTADVLTYNVALDAGAGSGSTTATRKLTSVGLNTLNYSLFGNVGRTQNWGNSQGVDTLASTANTSGSGTIKTFTVYGQLPANQTSPAASYSDSVGIVVNY